MLIVITPGRLLRWAPRWPCSDDAVLFDAASGDYWVLSAPGRAIIEALQAAAPLERAALIEGLAAPDADGEALIRSLAAAGLLMGQVDGSLVRLESQAED